MVNISPVLVQRSKRNSSSKRLAIPFDLHARLCHIGYDFIDDIIWQKPEEVGWQFGRGRRFSADRQPLQYKPLSVTEYVLVYRKSTDKTIDWNLRSEIDSDALERSLILDEYEHTNVWHIPTARHPVHPAVFPEELAKRVLRYYSVEQDVVLDPFAGVGTVGKVAKYMNRKYILIEQKGEYVNIIHNALNTIV